MAMLNISAFKPEHQSIVDSVIEMLEYNSVHVHYFNSMSKEIIVKGVSCSLTPIRINVEIDEEPNEKNSYYLINITVAVGADGIAKLECNGKQVNVSSDLEVLSRMIQIGEELYHLSL